MIRTTNSSQFHLMVHLQIQILPNGIKTRETIMTIVVVTVVVVVVLVIVVIVRARMLTMDINSQATTTRLRTIFPYERNKARTTDTRQTENDDIAILCTDV